MSAGLPRGAPLSAHFAILEISSSLSEGSFLKLWMPMFFSMYHGGMTPACGPIPVRALMALAYGRTSSYVDSDIGATPSARWQFSQLRCRTGAISFVYVTCAEPAFDCAVIVGCANSAAAPTKPATQTTLHPPDGMDMTDSL